MRGKDDYYAILAGSPELKKTIGILWLTWLICTTIIFTKITTGDYINFEYNIIVIIGIGMYPAVDIFSDITYVRKINKNLKVFLLILYVPNIVMLAIKEVVSIIGEIASGNSMDFEFIISQFAFISFWLLSIPIPIIKSKLNCILNMVLVAGFVVGWWAILTRSKWVMDIGEQGLIISALTIVAFSFIISLSLSIFRIRVILND